MARTDATAPLSIYRALRPRGPLDTDAEIDGAALETLFLANVRAVNDALELGYAIHADRFNWKYAWYGEHHAVDHFGQVRERRKRGRPEHLAVAWMHRVERAVEAAREQVAVQPRPAPTARRRANDGDRARLEQPLQAHSGRNLGNPAASNTTPTRMPTLTSEPSTFDVSNTPSSVPSSATRAIVYGAISAKVGVAWCTTTYDATAPVPGSACHWKLHE